MNAIVDLTARAVSFLTMIQSALLKGSITEKDPGQTISVLTILPENLQTKLLLYRQQELERQTATGKEDEDSFDKRAIELVWISARTPDTMVVIDYAVSICVRLSAWLRDDTGKLKSRFHNLLKNHNEFPTPYAWREAISHVIYEDVNERVTLAETLHYLPIQIVLALGGDVYEAADQMILQLWLNADNKEKEKKERNLLLSSSEQATLDKFSNHNPVESIKKLLMEDETLFNLLNKREVPLAFENIFRAELIEILKNRARRDNERALTSHGRPVNEGTIVFNDPFKEGKRMELKALAFSGGGIRSATFNLGILEGLAQKNLLGKFDYLSAVSGGGYISSWLAAWIKRDGSMVKVSNRLCPDKSPDPLGEELKPIKWLRMFSNYFAPNASIMSADAWTIGVTWLRNTLLNQVIIFMMLLSVMFAGNFLFAVWPVHPKAYEQGHHFIHDIHSYRLLVTWWSLGLLLPVAVLTGVGMHAYNSDRFWWIRLRKRITDYMSYLIIFLAFAGAYLASAWLSSSYYTSATGMPLQSFSEKVNMLWPAGAVMFGALLLVALIGKYGKLITGFGNNVPTAISIMLATALISAAGGLAALSAVGMLLEKIHDYYFHSGNYTVTIHASELRFIVGLPLIFEIFSLVVVTRMALLGKYFPDERREWWGRMGAYTHRLAFLWLMISASFLLGQKFIYYLFEQTSTGVTATGGWMALVGVAVRAAFSSRTSGKEDKKGALSGLLDILGKAGPYLFALGLLIFLPGLIQPLTDFIKAIIYKTSATYHFILPQTEPWLNLYIFLLTGIAAIVLSYQVGVNEFSMHYFYRNRLVRAYLGATRRSGDRQQTSNPFTGFDKKDDEKFADLQNKFGYYGPYLILNTALNASQQMDLDRQDRKAESFIFSPLFCGFDFSMVRSAADIKAKSYDYAYRETAKYADKGGPGVGLAMATSGAAVNPNQGYHSSPATAFLLTVFNVQLGRWISNPRKQNWKQEEPELGLAYIFNNLIGKTSTKDRFIALSDGGHFDNMGLYEMVRRRCTFIMLCDAEQDDEFTCEGLANAIRRCRIDFGAEIELDINGIINRNENRWSAMHHQIGTIRYAGDPLYDAADKTKPGATGTLLYIKSSITQQIPVDIREYAAKNKTFPHQTTADQFFDEEQFESYRRLGLYIADIALKDERLAGKI